VGRADAGTLPGAGFGVWLLVAILIIVAIFRIFFIAYLGPLNQLSKELKL
jgi:hypothetical protein